MGLAVSLELPLLIIDIQRGGPSTGLPTKTEAADLLLAMYGRHGESPLPIVAAHSPSDCFFAAIEAARIALKYRTPVVLLSDGYLANGTEPWRLPEVGSLPDISTTWATAPNHVTASGEEVFWPYLRDPDTLARAVALPGTPGLMHRIGGLEKEDGSGNVSYDSDNHERMVHLRAAKVAGIADDIAPVAVTGDVDDAELLVLGWGSTWGAIDGGMNRVRARGRRIAHAHLRHLNPFPKNLGEVLRRYPQGAGARDEPRPAVPARPGRVPRRRADREQGPRRALHRRRARSRHPRHPRRPPLTDLHPGHDQEGLVQRPGGALVPRLRRLLDPVGRAAADARPRRAARGHGVRVRHRLRGPVPVLHEHLRDALDPRARAGDRHRPRHGPPRPARVGRVRRRRRAVDRRQPPHPRAAPQHQHHDPDVQQPDLRAHQGPVLTDERARQGHQVDAVRQPRPPVQPARRSRSAPRRASWPAPTTWTATT